MCAALRILVPVKRVIDYAIKPRVNKARTGVETAGVKHSMNPFDEISVEEAVRIREASGGGGGGGIGPKRAAAPAVEDILVVSAGPARAADVLRTALAMGADRALHVEIPEGDAEPGPLTIAKLLARIAAEERTNLVILGKQSIDDDSCQTGQMVAGLLGWPQATQASRVEFGGGGAEQDGVTVTREVDGGVDTIRARLPMVITTDLRLNQPRYASLPNIMKAKKKPLVRKTLADYGIENETRVRVIRVEEPPPRKGGGTVEDVDGLVTRLKELGAL